MLPSSSNSIRRIESYNHFFALTHGRISHGWTYPVPCARKFYQTLLWLCQHKVSAYHLQVHHCLSRAEYLIPLGLCSLKISIFLISFNSKLFLTITFEVLQMLPPPQEDLEFPIDPPLSNNSSQESIPLPSGPIPLGYGVFELPECPRCFLGYSCNMHHSCHWLIILKTLLSS